MDVAETGPKADKTANTASLYLPLCVVSRAMEPSREKTLRDTIARLREKARRKVPESDAEDLVQEVLVVLVERLQRGNVDALQAYAEGILRHKIYDYYQSKRAQAVSLDGEFDLEGTGPSPEQRVVFMRHLRVIEGLAQENEVDQALVEEHFVRGAPLREVASQLQVSPGVVNGRLFRFRQKLTQRIGSCFATVVALVIGTWSRATRAWMAARAYGSVVGMLSIGSFASWVWWGQTPPPATQHNTTTQQAPFSISATPTPHPIARDAKVPPQPKETWYPSAHTAPTQPVLPQGLLPQDTTMRPSNDTLPAPSTKSRPVPQLPALPQAAPATRKHSILAILPAQVHTTKWSSTRQQIQKRNTTRRTTQRAAATTTKQTTNAGSQGSTPPAQRSAPPTQRQTPPTGRQTPPTGRPTNPATPSKPIVPTNPNIRADHFRNPGRVDSASSAMQQMNDFHTLRVGQGGAAPTTPGLKKRSFCVKQDGRLYDCSAGKMSDISGTNGQSPFGCGTNKMCKDMIGQGPSMLFSTSGDLYILGEKRYLASDDGGASWNNANQPKSVQQLLEKGRFILSQNGSLWERQNGSWKQVRKHQMDVQEVRVHLSEGKANFEDDTGFQFGATWKSLKERQFQQQPTAPKIDVTPAPGVDVQTPEGAPNNTIQPPNTRPIPTSLLP